MRVGIDRGDRNVLIASGALLLALTAASLALVPPQDAAPGLPSSHSTGPAGAKAAYLLLQELGYRVERWERPPAELPGDPRGVVLVVAGPVLPATDGEIQAIHRFVASGGRLLATEAAGAAFLPGGSALPRLPRPAGPRVLRARFPDPLARGASQIWMLESAVWKGRRSVPNVLYGPDGDPAVVSERTGAGIGIWWAGSTPLANSGLGREGNAALLLNAIGPASGIRVLWDEYYHGRRGSLWSYLGRTPVPWAFAQIGAAFLAACLTFGRRSGPVRPEVVEARLSPLEFVETMGDLYRRAGAASAAVEVAARRFRSALGRRLGIAPGAPAEAIAGAVARSFPGAPPGLLGTLEACERAAADPRLTAGAALRLVRDLRRHAAALRLDRS